MIGLLLLALASLCWLPMVAENEYNGESISGNEDISNNSISNNSSNANSSNSSSGTAVAAETPKDTTAMGIKLKENITSISEFNPEIGFFQKAYTDKSDPTFMITNETGSFQFGIGGTIHLSATHDFYGAVNHTKFVTWNIPVPTHRAGHFGLNIESSELYCKTKVIMGGRQMIGYLSVGAGDDGNITLGQAYISYAGLSVGQTYSFFMDLAAGVENVDLRGPNTQVSNTHALIGYTWPIDETWALAAACEKPSLDMYDYDTQGIYSEHQSMPDFAARLIYTRPFGHLQFSALYRTLRYRTVNELDADPGVYDNTTTRQCNGFGFALSGNINLSRTAFVTFQSIYGKGIQEYIQDYKNTQMDIIPSKRTNSETGETYYRMKTLPVWGGYIGLQNNFSPKFTVDGVLGMVAMKTPKVKNAAAFTSETLNYIDYKRTAYFALNAFYHINDFCTTGIGFLSGYKWMRERDEAKVLTGKNKRGHANRISLMFTYAF